MWAFVLIPILVWGYQYEKTLLKTQAKLAPRFFLMSEGAASDAAENFGICLVYEAGDEAAVSQFVHALNEAYPQGWKGYPLDIVESEYNAMPTKCRNESMLFLFNSNEGNIEKSVRFAMQNRKITMAYEPAYLEKGVLLSLYVGKSIRPYINLTAAKRAGIHFSSALKRISKVWTPPERTP